MHSKARSSALLSIMFLLVVAAGAACETTRATPAAAPDRLVGQSLTVRAADLRSDGVADLATLRGQVVIVDFWASWCAPCRESLPFYQRLYGERGKDGLQVLGISVDVERALAERFLSDVPTTFPMAWDTDQRLAASLQLDTMPTALIIDRAGVVRAFHKGFVAGDQATIEALVGTLLAEPSPQPPATAAAPAAAP